MPRTASPALSVGLAVRNAQDVVGRCVESILDQDFDDLELVVSDNASDDETVALLREYGRGDPRVRLTLNDVNIGSHENMNRVLDLSRGTYFRWISSDDWLEPGCLSACLDALGKHQDAIGVTTDLVIHAPDGSTRFEDYRGEFPTSPDPARRFSRMLWFFHAGDAKYDPIYGVFRREVLAGTHRLRRSEQTDWLLCAELALRGQITHVHRRLANRTRSYAVYADQRAHRRRLDPIHADELRSSTRRLHRDLSGLVTASSMTARQKAECRRALRTFLLKDAGLRGYAYAARAWRQLVGYGTRG